MKSYLLIVFLLTVSLWFVGLFTVVIFAQGLGGGNFLLYEYNKTVNLLEMIVLPIILILNVVGLVLVFKRVGKVL